MSKSAKGKARGHSVRTPDEVSLGKRAAWVVGLFVWLLVAASLVSHDAADAPTHAVAPVNAVAQNWIGEAGAFASYHAFHMLGIGAWVLLVSTGIWLVVAAWREQVNHVGVRLMGALILSQAISGFHALLFPSWSSLPEGGGGLLASYSMGVLSGAIGVLGSALLLVLATVVGLWAAHDRALGLIASAAGHMVGFAGSTATTVASTAKERAASAKEARQNDIDDDGRLKAVERFMEAARRRAKARGRIGIDENAGGIGGAGAFDADAEVVEVKPSKKGKAKAAVEPEEDDEYEYEYEDADEAEDGDEEYEYEDEELEDGEEYEDEEDEDLHEAAKVFTEDQLREKINQLPIRFATAKKESATQEDLDALRAQRKSEEEADKNYVFPGLDLLVEPEENFNDELEEWVREQAAALEQALQTYKIEGEVVGIDSGPVITLYRVRLSPGTKVSQLQPIASDIARMLKSVNIRIVPNEEGRDTVGIEVPNRKKEKVRLKELMTNSEMAGKMKLPMFLGKDASGQPLVVDLASLPHILIAGTTGSGKSVCMNAIIMGFLFTQKPSDLKLVLVDPKMVELSQFRDIPHLMCPVVTEMGKAAAILEWAVTKMDERYELLAEAGCRDIASYNDLGWEELKERFNPRNELEEAKIPRKLPYMVFVIDELADLMMTNKEVEGSIVRIAQKARAVGIHLVLATQRPQANVVTGLIKSNMPGRLSFRVASGMDSRIVLDMKGGELLLGQGDMLMLTPRSSTPMRSQGTLVDDSEIRRTVRFVREVSTPSFERSLTTLGDSGLSDGTTPKFTREEYEEKMRTSAQEDPLFDAAVEIVLESRRGSVSLLQRRLAIGYTRASRLIELMGMTGIIGAHKGSVAREVVMTIEEWQALKAFAEDQEKGGAELDAIEGSRELKQAGLFEGDKAEAAADAIAQQPFDAGTPEEDEAESTEDAVEAPPFVANVGEDGSAIEAEDVDGEDLEEDESEDEAEDALDDEGEEDEDEDGEEYVYLDEDGNEIDPDDEEYEYEYVDEEEEDAEEDEGEPEAVKGKGKK